MGPTDKPTTLPGINNRSNNDNGLNATEISLVCLVRFSWVRRKPSGERRSDCYRESVAVQRFRELILVGPTKTSFVIRSSYGRDCVVRAEPLWWYFLKFWKMSFMGWEMINGISLSLRIFPHVTCSTQLCSLFILME